MLIPARDEARALPELFARLDDLGAARPERVVVVDNGSRDDTAVVARGLGAEVVDEPRPGYGQACLAGIAHLASSGAAAVAVGGPPEVLIFLDADDFAAPAQIPHLLEPVERGDADLVIGERRALHGDGGVRWHARLGNRFVLSVLRLRFGSAVRDMGPFRAIRWRALTKLDLDDRDYGWYVQMQVRARRSGLRVVGIPVDFERRTVGTSKVSGNSLASVRAGWVMIRTLVAEIVRDDRYSRAEIKS